jgi:Mg-chelatase subunit ChlI
VEVPVPTAAELRTEGGEPSAAVAARVAAARRRQETRFAGRAPVNAAMDARDLRRWCALDESSSRLADAAFERLGLSARALARLLKVARTIADLGGQERVGAAHVAEALQYRCLDRPLVQQPTTPTLRALTPPRSRSEGDRGHHDHLPAPRGHRGLRVGDHEEDEELVHRSGDRRQRGEQRVR